MIFREIKPCQVVEQDVTKQIRPFLLVQGQVENPNVNLGLGGRRESFSFNYVNVITDMHDVTVFVNHDVSVVSVLNLQ